jgi:hypothetical protein
MRLAILGMILFFGSIILAQEIFIGLCYCIPTVSS